MFDIGWSEILVIVVVAIVVVGPKDLPPMLRAAGRMMAKMRRTAGEFQSQFNEALREAELDGVKESLDEIRGLNPMNAIKKQLDPIQAALASPTPIAKPAPEPVPPPMGQDARPASDEDIEPAAPPAAVIAPDAAPPAIVPGPSDEAAVETVAAPKRSRKAAETESSEKPEPRARKAKANGETSEPAPAKKPRATKAKPAAEIADATVAPEPSAAPAEPAPTSEERSA